MNAPTKSWLPAFIICALFWGSSFLFIHEAIKSFTASQVAFGRVVVGALVLGGMLLAQRRRPRFSWREIGSVALVALLLSVVPFILIPIAQEHITSILASLLNATTPLWTALFVALLIPTEKASRLQVVGLVIGAFGIAVLLGAWNVSDLPMLGAVLMLAATACYGLGSTMSRLFLSSVKETPTGLSAAQMGLSAIMLAPVALVTAPSDPPTLHGSAVWALLALGLFGTSFAYVLFYQVVRVAGATTAASTTYVVPIVATFLGIIVLKEHLHWYEPVGAVVVLGGVWLAQRKPKVLEVEAKAAHA
ncbi:DMT family transporter [Demequina sp.]|uniref:DMT family transporter n=1 Tax=Demequina sp. TaxID=2050685 RepID=UPI003D14D655